jgi:hypothetical protein
MLWINLNCFFLSKIRQIWKLIKIDKVVDYWSADKLLCLNKQILPLNTMKIKCAYKLKSNHFVKFTLWWYICQNMMIISATNTLADYHKNNQIYFAGSCVLLNIGYVNLMVIRHYCRVLLYVECIVAFKSNTIMQ